MRQNSKMKFWLLSLVGLEAGVRFQNENRTIMVYFSNF
jgi:hypothetical protein